MAQDSAAVPSGIFISYRRQETAYPAGWLYQRLRDHFGSEQVFKDVDNLVPGDDFHEKIDQAVASCAVLLALIGNEWLDVVDANGSRRLDDPQDFVRLEIEAALRRGVRVVPLLLDGARMPRPEALPDSLSGLARRHAVELTPERFEADTARLLGVLERSLAGTTAPAPTPAPARPAPSPTSSPGPSAPVLHLPRAVTSAVRPPDTPATSAGPAAPQRLPGGRTPSGLPLWVPAVLVVATSVLVWVNLPASTGQEHAWKDEAESGWEAFRSWHDAFVWAPLLALAGAVASVRLRPALGLTFGAAAFTLGSAVMVLAGGLSADQTLEWSVSALTAALCVVLCLRVAGPPLRGVLSIPITVLAVLVGAGLWVGADAVEHDYYVWLGITEGSALARQVMLLVAAWPVLVCLGGMRWRAAFLVGGITTVALALLDVLTYAREVGPTVTWLWVAAIAAWAAGVALAGSANLLVGRTSGMTA